ncbi:MAG: FAD/NAD(P)-binding protein [Leuconostoc carnosum]|uniref:FAD/NAD(P)-binding protein n=1 Tax=Leuconostoc carnosum TaxID=1252 RepID=UPI003F98F8B0
MQVAIIGAGPRGLAIAERLINLADDKTQLDVQIYDPYTIGGRVWDPFIVNNKLFLMNTVIDQVTLFNDDSIENGGTPFPGPNMRQWIETEAQAFLASHSEYDRRYSDELRYLTQPGDFSSRGMLGVYAAWYFNWLKSRVRSNHTLTFTQQAVNNLKKIGTKFELNLTDGTQMLADHVVMALGHSDVELTEEERQFDNFATQHGLQYVGPTHPAEADLSKFSDKDTIIMRGLGLSFFDYLAYFSIGRGGQFVRADDGELVYQASGNEPHVIAGSRGGLPLRARGVNQKSTSELYQPTFLTLPALDALRAKGGGYMAYDDFEKLMIKELTYKYISNILSSDQQTLTYNQTEALKQALLTSADLIETARSFGLTDYPIFDVEDICHPSRQLDADADYKAWFLDYLKSTIDDARLGNKLAPLAGTFDILRDLRNWVRHVVEHDYFSADDYEKFLSRFKPFDSLVSVGPSLERTEELYALMKAGIFEVTAPGIKVTTENGAFVARDRRHQEFKGNALIEARLGTTSIAVARNPLIVHLRDNGILVQPVRTRRNGSTYKLDAANVDHQTFEVINRDGELVNNLYIYGIPLEGLKWFSTVIPRPGVNTIILREGAWIAERILAHA